MELTEKQAKAIDELRFHETYKNMEMEVKFKKDKTEAYVTFKKDKEKYTYIITENGDVHYNK